MDDDPEDFIGINPHHCKSEGKKESTNVTLESGEEFLEVTTSEKLTNDNQVNTKETEIVGATVQETSFTSRHQDGVCKV